MGGVIEERLGRVDVFSNRSIDVRGRGAGAGAAVASRFAEPITNSLRASRRVWKDGAGEGLEAAQRRLSEAQVRAGAPRRPPPKRDAPLKRGSLVGAAGVLK